MRVLSRNQILKRWEAERPVGNCCHLPPALEFTQASQERAILAQRVLTFTKAPLTGWGLYLQEISHTYVERFHFFNPMLPFIFRYGTGYLCDLNHSGIRLVENWNFEILGNADTQA